MKPGLHGLFMDVTATLCGVLPGRQMQAFSVMGLRRRRRAGPIELQPRAVSPGLPSMAHGAPVFEQLVLKAMQRQGYGIVSSKTIPGLARLWIIQKSDKRQGLVCLNKGTFFECGILKQVSEAIHQEGLIVGTVVALGGFSFPAKRLAKELHMSLIPRGEVFKLIEGELKSDASGQDAETLIRQLTRAQSDLALTQAQVKTLEQELSTHTEFKQQTKAELEAWEKEAETLREKWQETGRCLDEERTRKQALEQQASELTRQLTATKRRYGEVSRELEQLRAKTAEADERMAAEHKARVQLEAQSAQLKEQLRETTSEQVCIPKESRQGSERRQWTRRHLST